MILSERNNLSISTIMGHIDRIGGYAALEGFLYDGSAGFSVAVD